jgi:ferritin-like metal-binding protein YciE
MALKSLDDLFVHFLRDMHNAEQQVLAALPAMSDSAAGELRKTLDDHRDETEQQIANLERVFEMLGVEPDGVNCTAIDGILAEGRAIIAEAEQRDAREAGLIAAAQAIEHYEITRYGTLFAWATELGKPEAAKLLRANLEQEYAADRKLTDLAGRTLNREAA